MIRIAIPGALALPALALLTSDLPAQRGGGNQAQVWKFLAEQYDKDGDGEITLAEYPRGERQFGNLDRDDDGVLTEADFQRRRRGEGNRGEGRNRRPEPVPDEQLARRLGDMYGSFLNVDGEPGLSKKDWDALLARLDPNEEGVIADERVRAITGLAGQGRMARFTRGITNVFDRDGDGTITVDDLQAAFATLDEDGDGLVEQGDEIDMPPGVGQIAPDFTLPFAKDAEKTITLSSFRGKKPVALIFGSYT